MQGSCKTKAIADELRGRQPQRGHRLHGALTALAHTLSLKLAANLRQIDDSCFKLKTYHFRTGPGSQLQRPADNAARVIQLELADGPDASRLKL